MVYNTNEYCKFGDYNFLNNKLIKTKHFLTILIARLKALLKKSLVLKI